MAQNMMFDHTMVSGFEAAIRGARNPYNSHAKMDSVGDALGDADKDLMVRLIKAGSEHRKFMRYIHVSVDVTAPFYWWKEYDTYKISTTANSESTMHTIHKKEINLNLFATEDFHPELVVREADYNPDLDTKIGDVVNIYMEMLEGLRRKYLELNAEESTKEKAKIYWKEIIRWLPSGFLQMRTLDLNYETIYRILRQRRGHKLSEWTKDFINWAKRLPYAEELLFCDDLKDLYNKE